MSHHEISITTNSNPNFGSKLKLILTRAPPSLGKFCARLKQFPGQRSNKQIVQQHNVSKWTKGPKQIDCMDHMFWNRRTQAANQRAQDIGKQYGAFDWHDTSPEVPLCHIPLQIERHAERLDRSAPKNLDFRVKIRNRGHQKWCITMIFFQIKYTFLNSVT